MKIHRSVLVRARAARVVLLLSSLAGCQGVTDPAGSFARASIAFDQLAGGKVLLTAYATGAGKETYLFDGAARTVVRLPVVSDWFEQDLALSPDGTRIVHRLVEVISLNSGSVTTVVVNVDGSDARELGGSSWALPSWSPDGSAVYYGGGSSVRRQSLAGDELPEFVQSVGAFGCRAGSSPVSVSASGQIAYDCEWRAILVLTPPATVDTVAELVDLVSQSVTAWPLWSPDGTRLAYVALEPRGYRVIVVETATGEVVTTMETVRAGGQPFCWQRSGDGILVIRNGANDAGLAVYAVPVSGGPTVLVVPNPGREFSMTSLSCSLTSA